MITFTRAATQELQEKFSDAEVAITERPPSTAHSFALRLLMRKRHEKLRMADDWEKRFLVEEAVAARMREAGHSVSIKEVQKLTNEMAAGWQSLDEGQILLSDWDPDLAAGFRGAWTEAQRTLGFVHVSEIPYKAVQLVEDVGIDDLDLDVLVVDEFQDLNAAEVRLLELLSDQVQIIAIGDDDQSIYSCATPLPAPYCGFATITVQDPSSSQSAIAHRRMSSTRLLKLSGRCRGGRRRTGSYQVIQTVLASSLSFDRKFGS